MIRTLSISLLLALLVQPALAQALKPSVSVSAEIVTLGDLISDAGAKADFAVFRAPDLGQTGKVPAQDILNAAAAQGLGHVETGGLDAVSVTRASRMVTSDELRTPLLAALSAQAGVDDLEAVEVTIDPAFARIQLPVEADGAIQVADAVWHSERGAFDAVLLIRRVDGRDERRVISGQALETVAVLTTTRALERGTLIAPSDVAVERKPRAEVRTESLADAGVAVGMEVRRALREGQPVRSADLAQPTLVKSGSTVSIVLKSGGLTLTASAQALRDGKMGETIQVMNVQSKRVLQALVVGADQVAIQTPRTIVSAAK